MDLSSDSSKATFVLKDLPLPSPLPDDTLLLQTLYISNDPAFRLFVQADAGAVNRSRKKISGAEKGAPMKSVAVLRVLKVGSDGQGNIKEGDIVQRSPPGLSTQFSRKSKSQSCSMSSSTSEQITY